MDDNEGGRSLRHGWTAVMAKRLKDHSIQENARACRLIGKATVWQALAASPISPNYLKPCHGHYNQLPAKSPLRICNVCLSQLLADEIKVKLSAVVFIP